MGRPRLRDLQGFFEDTKAVIDEEALVETEELDISKDMQEGPKSGLIGKRELVRSGAR